MRWRYPDPGDIAEARRRSRVIKAMDAWWKAFASRADDCVAMFRGQKRWDLVGFMREQLEAVSPNLFWEFGPGDGGGHRLVITPEGHHELRPLVEALLGRAPALPGWSFAAHRPPEELAMALQSVTAKGGKDVSRARALVTPGERHQIRLTFTSPDFFGTDDPGDRQAVFWLIESLLGEAAIDRWVGVVVTRKRAPGRKVPLARLREAFEAQVAAVREALPSEPWAERRGSATWTAYQLSPDPDRGEYARQEDLIVATSVLPPAWHEARLGSLFWSGRFSRHGEVFAYLKVPTGLPPSEALPIRQALEEVCTLRD